MQHQILMVSAGNLFLHLKRALNVRERGKNTRKNSEIEETE